MIAMINCSITDGRLKPMNIAESSANLSCENGTRSLFACDVCGRMYQHKRSMLSHLRLHSSTNEDNNTGVVAVNTGITAPKDNTSHGNSIVEGGKNTL